MNEHLTLEARPEDEGSRVDAYLSAHIPELSRSLLHRLIGDGKVQINGRSVKASRRVRTGDRVSAQLEIPPSLSAAPEDIELNVIYSDEDVAVIDKPAGMVVHPAAGHSGGTLANALVALFPGTAAVGPRQRPGIVHRLDKGTSGLMVVALTPRAQGSLHAQIAERTARRSYLALVQGVFEPLTGVIDAPIGRDPKDRMRMATYGVAARPAQTGFRTKEVLRDYSLVEASLHTGRTHQIRVHFMATGHPIAGDTVYRGATLPGLNRQFLHAFRLAFRSPATGEEFEFHSELPDDLQNVLNNLRS